MSCGYVPVEGLLYAETQPFSPCLLCLRPPDDGRWKSNFFLSNLVIRRRAHQTKVQLYLEIGDCKIGMIAAEEQRLKKQNQKGKGRGKERIQQKTKIEFGRVAIGRVAKVRLQSLSVQSTD